MCFLFNINHTATRSPCRGVEQEHLCMTVSTSLYIFSDAVKEDKEKRTRKKRKPTGENNRKEYKHRNLRAYMDKHTLTRPCYTIKTPNSTPCAHTYSHNGSPPRKTVVHKSHTPITLPSTQHIFQTQDQGTQTTNVSTCTPYTVGTLKKQNLRSVKQYTKTDLALRSLFSHASARATIVNRPTFNRRTVMGTSRITNYTTHVIFHSHHNLL